MPSNIFGQNPHYKFRDQDPVINHMRTIVQANGDSYTSAAHKCHMHPSTFRCWFVTGETHSPRHDSVQIFYHTYGIEYGARSNLRIVASNGRKARKTKAA